MPRRGAQGGIRVDTHIQAASSVPPDYDSLLAKIITRGAGRDEAIQEMRSALGLCAIDGVTTNLAMHRAVLADEEFRRGGVDTGYLERAMSGSLAGTFGLKEGVGPG